MKSLVLQHQTEVAEADHEQHVWLSGIWDRSSCDQAGLRGKCL